MRVIVISLLLARALATHYEDPKNGCGSDEQAIQVTGVSGDFCSPPCNGTVCPTDPPSPSDAKPQCALKSSTGDLFKAIRSDMFSDSEKGVNMELPKGWVDMQSDHACACFVRIGRCCLGSILGSIWESFWEPSSPLYSFLVALVANRAPK